MDASPRIQSAARKRLEAQNLGKTRVAVQVGHCSQALDAGEVAQALEQALSQRRDAHLVVVGCDGACFAAPQVILSRPGGIVRYHSRVTLDDVPEITRSLDASTNLLPGADLEGFFAPQYMSVMARCGQIDPSEVDEYLAGGGYGALHKALSQSPEQVIAEVLRSGLQGRGGAYFPAGRKWQAARSVKATTRYLVVNAEEGEPGLFKDRHLMEGDPHQLLEGMLIAAYAAGASRCYLYVNAGANLSAQRMERAIGQARNLGLIGANILETGFDCAPHPRRGAGTNPGNGVGRW